MSSHSTIARLQQVLVVATLLGALGWAGTWWPHAPGVALAGALALAVGPSWVLAVEFALLVVIRRGDPAPRASAGALLRAWLAESCQALAVFAWRQPFRWRAIPDRLAGPRVAGRRGVVFVHGFVCNRGFWTPWRERLEAEGRAHVSVNLEPPFTTLDAYADPVDEAVQRVRAVTGLPPLLVCHSMGGLVARVWWRARGQADAVLRVVTIASPHGGTWLARFSHLPNGRQMRQDSDWLQALRAAEPLDRAARFTCWWSDCDNIVMPPSAATWPGADNRFVPGAAHVQLAFHPQVMAGTLALLDLDAASAADQAASNSG